MREIIVLFFASMTPENKRKFRIYLLVLFVGSVSATLGIGAVMPFIYVLIDPSKLYSYSFLKGYNYHFLVVCFSLLLILAFWIKNAVSLFLLLYQANFIGSLVQGVQQRLFRLYLLMPYTDHLNRSSPTLIKNITIETNQFSTGVANSIGVILTEGLASLFVLVALFFINMVFTLCILCGVLLVVWLFMRVFRKRLKAHAEARANAYMYVTRNAIDGLNGIKEVKIYHKEQALIKNFNAYAQQLRKATVMNNILGQAPKQLIEVSGLTIVMLVMLTFILIGSSSQSLVVLLIVFGMAAAQLLPSLNKISQCLVSLRYSYPALRTIYNELVVKGVSISNLDVVNSSDKAKASYQNLISLNNISFSFEGGDPVLSGVNVKLPKNSKVAIVGASGAGKTTLVDLLMGLYQPDSGVIELDGNVIKSRKEIQAFQGLFGYIPQQIVIYDYSIKHNVAFGHVDVDEKRVWECLKIANLDAFVRGLPKQLDAFVGEGGMKISGGQRQRLGIARALYHKPEVLVMDEATAALDNDTESVVTKILTELDNMTLVTIAHRLSTIKNYDYIYFLSAGKVVGSGSYDELYSKCELFRKMHGETWCG